MRRTTRKMKQSEKKKAYAEVDKMELEIVSIRLGDNMEDFLEK